MEWTSSALIRSQTRVAGGASPAFAPDGPAIWAAAPQQVSSTRTMAAPDRSRIPSPHPVSPTHIEDDASAGQNGCSK
jgi:hypothetical protein